MKTEPIEQAQPSLDEDQEHQHSSFQQGIKDCIPTLLGYWSVGFAAGVVETTAGLSIAEVGLISLLLYAGSAQFIVAGMLASSGSMFSIIITVFFVNLRHLLMSAALSPYFRHLSSLKNMLIGALLTDETFSVAINATAKKQKLNERWMNGLNLTAYLNWFIANMAGAVLGQWITNPEHLGLDYALPAMFIGLLVISIRSRGTIRRDIVVVTCAGVITIAVSLVASASTAVIIAAILASTIGMVIEKWK